MKDMLRKISDSVHTAAARRLLTVGATALLLLIPTGILLYFILGPGEGYLHSDCTDTLWWANASYESGQWISDNFAYAALLPFGGSLLMLPFIPLFGVSVATHNAGMILFVILFVAAGYFFGRSLQLSPPAAAGVPLMLCLLLSGSVKLREIMWGHIIYYSLGILFFLFGMGLCFRLCRALDAHDRRGVQVYGVLLTLFTVLTALNELLSVVTWLLPAAAAIMAYLLFDRWDAAAATLTRRRTAVAGILLAGACVGMLFGQLIRHGVVAGYAEAYSMYDDMSAWKGNLQDLPFQWLSLFGVSIKDGTHLISASSLLCMIQIACAVLIFTLPFVALIFRKTVKNPWVIPACIGHIALTLCILYAAIFGRLGAAEWRLTPLIGTGIAAGYPALLDWIRQVRLPRARLAGAVLLLFTVCALAHGALILRMPADYGRDNAYHRIADVLREEELTTGYASFWNCHVVSLLSDGEAELFPIETSGTTVPKKRYYQSPYDAYGRVGQEEECFLLLSSGEYTQFLSWLSEQENISETLRYPEIGYYVIVFDGPIAFAD